MERKRKKEKNLHTQNKIIGSQIIRIKAKTKKKKEKKIKNTEHYD